MDPSGHISIFGPTLADKSVVRCDWHWREKIYLHAKGKCYIYINFILYFIYFLLFKGI